MDEGRQPAAERRSLVTVRDTVTVTPAKRSFRSLPDSAPYSRTFASSADERDNEREKRLSERNSPPDRTSYASSTGKASLTATLATLDAKSGWMILYSSREKRTTDRSGMSLNPSLPSSATPDSSRTGLPERASQRYTDPPASRT